MLKTTSIAPPWGVLPVGPETSTTEVEKDVYGGPHGGRCRRVRQRPPPMLKTSSMAGPVASTTEVEEDVNGGARGGAVGGSDNVHHRY
jgi:hypothetical protein